MGRSSWRHTEVASGRERCPLDGVQYWRGVMEGLSNISELRKAVKEAEKGTGSVRKAIQSARFFISGREFTGLIRACRNSKQWEKALEILETVRLEDSSVGESTSFYTFSATISVCSKSGRLREAMWLLNEMKAAGTKDPSLKPDAAVYRLILLCCVRQGDCKTAVDILDEMFLGGLETDEETLKRVLLGLVQGGSWQHALWLLDELHARGETLPTEHYSDFIRCSVEKDNLTIATEVFIMMQMAGVKPNACICHHIVLGILVSGDLEFALQFVKEMHACGIPVFEQTYKCLSRASMAVESTDLTANAA